MTIDYAHISTVTNSTTGTQTFSSTDFGGGTPEFALIWMTRDDSQSAGAKSHAAWCLGATDGTNQWAMSGSSRSAVNPTDTCRFGSTSHCAAMNKTADPTDFRVKGDFDSWTTNGIIIDWTTNDGSTYTIDILLLGGDAFSAHVGSDLPSTSAGGTVTVSSGFAPDLIIGGSLGANITGTNGIADNIFSIGFSTSTSDIAYGWNNEEGNTGGDVVAGRIDTSYPISLVDNTGATTERYSFNYGSNDFEIESETANAGTDRIYYAALEFTQSSVYVGSITTASSTGNQAYTDFGFETMFVLSFGTLMAALDTAYADASAGSFSMGFMTSTTQGSNAATVESGSSSSDTQSQYDPYSLFNEDHNGGSGYRADYVSISSTGWTWDWLNVTVSSKKAFVIGVEVDDTAVPVGDGGLLSNSVLMRARQSHHLRR
jgi:hypothetical protein